MSTVQMIVKLLNFDKKISLYILIIVSLLAFSIKSSTINFDQKYQDLNIKTDKSMVFGDLMVFQINLV